MSSADAELLSRAAAGNELAFRALLGRHDATMRAVARRFSDARVEAADIVQEATLCAWQAARTFRGDSEVRTWLLGITLNVCRRSRRRRADEPAALDPLEGHHLVAAAEEPHPVTVDLHLRLRRALRGLATEDREVIVLRDMVGMSGAETAVALEISVAAMKSRLHRARLALKREVEGGEAARPAARADTFGCADVLEDLSLYMDGELGAEGAAAIDEHLRECDRCTRFGGDLARILTSLRESLLAGD